MDINVLEIQSLIDRPRESLSVELKRWIDPNSSEGKAKIAKAALALRNFNGGYLIIGFDDTTLKPDKENTPNNVLDMFHIDNVQGIVTKFASEAFEVSVEFPERDGQVFPVMIVPSGVKVPVVAKSNLIQQATKKKLISIGDVYFRSLRSNNTPSTTIAKWNDWPDITSICFDNREADIGRFLRRHLGSVTPDLLNQLAVANQPKPTDEEILQTYLNESKGRYQHIVEERRVELPQHGSWEVALRIKGEISGQHSANQDFLNLLNATNPQYSGWPVWLDSRRMASADRPFVQEGVWESLLFRPLGWGRGIDFIRLDPRGNFYQYRALEDDFTTQERGPAPLTSLDFGIQIYRCTEAIAVGLAFAKAMGCDSDSSVLSFAFRWSGLRDRTLSRWAQPRWIGGPSRATAYQDEHISYLNLPLDTPLSAIGTYTNQVVKPLFELFDGFVLPDSSVEEITRRCIERKSFA